METATDTELPVDEDDTLCLPCEAEGGADAEENANYVGDDEKEQHVETCALCLDPLRFEDWEKADIAHEVARAGSFTKAHEAYRNIVLIRCASAKCGLQSCHDHCLKEDRRVDLKCWICRSSNT